MESITACALARVRAISTESVSGGMIGASGSRTAGVRRAIPHDATANAAKTPMIHLVPLIANAGRTCKVSKFSRHMQKSGKEGGERRVIQRPG